MRIQLSDHFSYVRLIRFTLPSIAMMIFTSIYGVVDGFFVSNYAGKTHFAAVNLIIPVLLILVIQGSIWINYGIPTITNSPLFFLSYLVVSSIQMGANIDYAIVTTSRFMEFKDKMPKKDAIIETMNLAFPTIITSGLMMVIAGILIGQMTSNAAIAGSMVKVLAPLAIDAALMLFYLVVMFRYSALLTLMGVASIVINLSLSRLIAKKRVNITRVQQRDEGKLAGTTVAGIEMIETIKSSGAENGFFERWAGYQASVNTQKVRYEKLSQYLGALPSLVSSVTNSAVMMAGVWLTINGEFTAGMILAFQGFLTEFGEPAMTLVSAGQTIQEMRTDMERVEDVMQYPEDAVYGPETQLRDDVEYDKLSGSVVMRGVTFGYSRLAEPLIEDFDLTLRPGSRVALVGASGCGKSTIAKLIAGLYQPWSGEILFDGKPINEIDRSVFTGSLAVVDQDIILFEDTIANNIKMWDSSIEDFEMILAARDASLHEDIMQREGGYNCRLAEGGKDLSGGQRQRLEIARVLAQDPTIIILDEATSALDARTEYEVVRSINERGITCIVVAHRLSTIRDCDEIIVLDHGKVTERGTHEELYALGGAYTRLISNE